MGKKGKSRKQAVPAEESSFTQQLRAAASRRLCPDDADKFIKVLNEADICVRDDLDYYTTQHVMMAFVRSDFGDRSDVDPLDLTRIVEEVKATDTEAEKIFIMSDRAGGKAQGRETQGRSTSMGAMALGSDALGTEPQHRSAKGGIQMPKPNEGDLDEDRWQSSLQKAVTEVEQQYGIAVDSYYEHMCTVGQKLLMEKIQQKAQGIYKYRAGKRVYRRNRKQP